MNRTDKTQYKVPSILLKPVVSVLAEKFIDYKRLLMRLGLSPNVLHQANHLIDYSTFTQMLNEGAALAGEVEFGFLAGKKLGLDNAGIIVPLITSQTCIANIYPAIDYLFNTQQNGARHHLAIQGKIATHSIDYLLDDQLQCQQIAQFTLTGYINIFRLALGSHFQPKRILIKSDKVFPTPQMTAYCGCPVITGSDHNAIEFERALLYQGTEDIDQISRESKQTLAKVLLECDDLARLVGSYIEFGLAEGDFDKATIARCLGVHPRVFQNCLQARGLEYKQILQEIRFKNAQKLLLNSDIPISDVALQLGYSESRVFSRAFKMWSGTTPLQFRKSGPSP